MFFKKSKQYLEITFSPAKHSVVCARYWRVNSLAALFLIVFSSAVIAGPTNPPAVGQQALSGLGSSNPAKQNVSQSPNYNVYKWKLGDTDFVQINNLNGNVLAVYAITKHGSERLNMGSLPTDSDKLRSGAGPIIGESSSPKEEGDGQCPCGSTIVGNGPGYVIYVITDSNGNVIKTYVVHFPVQAK